MYAPALLGYVFDSAPRDLPLWLITLGLEAMMIGTSTLAIRNASVDLNPHVRHLAVLSFGLGYFFILLSVISQYYALYAAFLFVLFRTLEGAVAVQIYARIATFLRTKSWTGNSAAKLRHRLASFFVLALGSYLAIKVLVDGPLINSVVYDLSLIYTVTVVVLTVLSVRWRLKELDRGVNAGVLWGMALGIAGAHVYDFTLGQNLLVDAIAALCYSGGFWVAAGVLFRNGLSAGTDADTCHDCQGDLSGTPTPTSARTAGPHSLDRPGVRTRDAACEPGRRPRDGDRGQCALSAEKIY